MSTKSTATKWGIVGAGKICSDFTSAILSCPASDVIEHKIVAVAARDQDRAQEFANRFHIPKAYGSYKELAEDPEIEVTYIGVVHPMHAELSKMYLESGKHVLCEKPVTLNGKQLKEVIAVAKEKKLFFMEGFWTRFFPVITKLREDLSANTIGDLKYMICSCGVDLDTPCPEYTTKTYGGSLLSLGCYCVMMTNLLFGPEKPKHIAASGILYPSGVDEMSSATLQFSNNRLVTFTSSLSVTLDNTMTLCGTNGFITIPQFSEPSEIMVSGETFSYPHPSSPDIFKYNFPGKEALQYEVQTVRECLIKGELMHPLMTHADSLWIMEVMDEIRRQIGVHFDEDD